MGDFGIRISEADFDVNTTPTESNKKNFVYLSDENTPKVYYAGFLTAADPFSGMTYEHNLGYVPIFFFFLTDSASSPTYYRYVNAVSSTTTITQTIGGYGYLIILEEGSS